MPLTHLLVIAPGTVVSHHARMKHLGSLIILVILGVAAVTGHAAILLRDDFAYADGALTNVSAMKWRTHSGTPGELNVAGGSVLLSRLETEDVNAALAASVVPASGGVIYSRFTFVLTELPVSSKATFFAHLNGSSSQRGRIFLTTGGAGAGRFRLGIANATNSPSAVCLTNLFPNQTYTVITRYVVSNAVSTLWIDPVSEFSASITGVDVGIATPISAFSWRQDDDLGQMIVDDLFVTTCFTEALVGNATPFISTVPPQQIVVGGTTHVPFVFGDADTVAEGLQVWAYATNTVLGTNLSVWASGSNGTLSITAAPEFIDETLITIGVTDGFSTNRSSFLLSALPALLLADDFNYAGGPLISNAAPTWVHHGGGTGEIQVVNGQISMGEPFTEDVNALLPFGPFVPESRLTFYTSLRINFSELPGSSGDYIAHFNPSGARCRLIANTLTAAPGKFRLAIANANVALAQTWPVDLVTNLSYLVVLRYDPRTAMSTLWVNPLSEISPGTNATDVAAPVPLSAFCFRQSASIGKFTVDDLRVGLNFAAVTADSLTPRLKIQCVSPQVMRISWPATLSGFALQSSTELDAPAWYDVEERPVLIGSEFVVTNMVAMSTELFRLRRLGPVP